MLLTFTNLKQVTGAQMRDFQACKGYFIDEDMLVLDTSEVECMAMLERLPGEVRRASEDEADAWFELQLELVSACFGRQLPQAPTPAQWEKIRRVSKRWLEGAWIH